MNDTTGGAMDLTEKIPSGEESPKKTGAVPFIELKEPWKDPLWRERALWLLEQHPKYALRLLDQGELEESLNYSTNSAVSMLLELKRRGMTDSEARETVLREMIAPPSEPPETRVSRKDRNRYNAWLMENC